MWIDAVKFQKEQLKLFIPKKIWINLERVWGTTQREQKEGLEFSREQYDEIDKYCRKKNIIWFASAWDLNSLEFLDRYNLNYHKIASAMIVDKVLLEEVAKRKKHTFISTGMSKLSDIEKAVEIFQNNGTSFELMPPGPNHTLFYLK